MDSKLLDKLNKLFAVAEKSSFPEEAANALAKAQNIMTQHKISKAMLDEYEEEEEIKTFNDKPLNEEDSHKRNKAVWKGSLSGVLAKLNGCFVFTRGSEIIITGKESNVSTVRYLYKYCVAEIDRLAKLNCKGRGRTFANNFRFGCVTAIKEAMTKEQEEIRNKAQSDKKELVVVDRVLAKIRSDYLEAERFTRSNSRLRSSSHRAYGSAEGQAAGYNAGQSIYKGRRSGSLPSPQRKLTF